MIIYNFFKNLIINNMVRLAKAYKKKMRERRKSKKQREEGRDREKPMAEEKKKVF